MSERYLNKIEHGQMNTVLRNWEKKLNTDDRFEVMGTTELPLKYSIPISQDDRYIEITKFDKTHEEMPKHITFSYTYWYYENPRIKFYEVNDNGEFTMKRIPRPLTYIKKALEIV